MSCSLVILRAQAGGVAEVVEAQGAFVGRRFLPPFAVILVRAVPPVGVAVARFATDAVVEAELADALDDIGRGLVEIGMDVAAQTKQIAFGLGCLPIRETMQTLLDLLRTIVEQNRVSLIVLVGDAQSVLATGDLGGVGTIVTCRSGARAGAEQLKGAFVGTRERGGRIAVRVGDGRPPNEQQTDRDGE